MSSAAASPPPKGVTPPKQGTPAVQTVLKEELVQELVRARLFWYCAGTGPMSDAFLFIVLEVKGWGGVEGYRSTPT